MQHALHSVQATHPAPIALSLAPHGFPSSAEHRFTEAVEGYTKAIELNPDNAVYYANRAAAHIHLENFGCALADASKAIELDPKYTKVRPIKLFTASAFRHDSGAHTCATSHENDLISVTPHRAKAPVLQWPVSSV